MAEKEGSVQTAEAEAPSAQPEKHSWLRDMLYPFNHAISCLFTDSLIQPFVGAWVQHRVEDRKLPTWLSGIFETHDHHGHHAHDPAHKQSFISNAKHWFSGEVIGDLAAVPLTALTHHLVPGVASGIRKVSEPVVGWYFRRGAERGAKNWALDNNLDPSGPEAQAKKEALYKYEMSHLGDVLTWNALSAAINVETQKQMGSTANRKTLYTGKLFGTVVSNALLLSARASAPRLFQRNEERIAKGVHEVFGSHEHAAHGAGESRGVAR